jgi:broad specificity phosphatase PhoE
LLALSGEKLQKKKSDSVQITYFVHGTTIDNEREIASGWANAELSELGKKQSIELKKQIAGKKFVVVFCSDLKRAIDSAELTFGNNIPIIKDSRLREINYGDLTGENSNEVEKEIYNCIDNAFPNGESYKDVEERVREFLLDLQKEYSGNHIAIVAHRATQLAIEVILNNKTWQQAIAEDWRNKKPKAWKPGWDYELKKI